MPGIRTQAHAPYSTTTRPVAEYSAWARTPRSAGWRGYGWAEQTSTTRSQVIPRRATQPAGDRTVRNSTTTPPKVVAKKPNSRTELPHVDMADSSPRGTANCVAQQELWPTSLQGGSRSLTPTLRIECGASRWAA